MGSTYSPHKAVVLEGLNDITHIGTVSGKKSSANVSCYYFLLSIILPIFNVYLVQIAPPPLHFFPEEKERNTNSDRHSVSFSLSPHFILIFFPSHYIWL